MWLMSQQPTLQQRPTAGRRTTPAARRRGEHDAAALAVALGTTVRGARRRRRLTQEQLADRVAVHQSRISQIELGGGGASPLDLRLAIAAVLELPLRVEFGRDRLQEPSDAGHLRIQELVLRLGARAGFTRTFELASAGGSGRSSDVGLRDDRRRILILIECCNTLLDLGAAVRSSDRKRAEAEAYAVAIGHGEPFEVRTCWVVRASAANRALVARSPHIFATKFPGSSRGWVEALTVGGRPPAQPGLVWSDVGASRLFAWRSRSEA